ncbi:MAG TPA: hypothetical protein VL371_19215 [Gemmataceae bacterium]|nr:hypothetical protein [Gemmataceae bacterium]
MQKKWRVTLVLLAGLAGCGPAPVAVGPTHVAAWIDVSVGGKRYYGLYLKETAGPDGQIVAASGVLLMPWDDRPECSISGEGGETEVLLPGRKQTFPGRPLLQLTSSDAALKVIADDIDLSHYQSRRTLEEAVKGLLAAGPAPER